VSALDDNNQSPRYSNREFEQLRKAVLAALALPESERASYLKRELGKDELVADALSLLASDPDRADRVIDGSVRSVLEEALDDADRTADLGRTLGPYRLERVLGRGGMGVVYLAHQQEPIERRVALKIVTGAAIMPSILRRFELERRLLGQLDHPNIAKVLDANQTEDGRPYFVLEYVDGVPINDYCREHAPSLRERLVLFLQVCRAVDHAHRRGIIHRDLKPSNLLVSRQDGLPLAKVIDFGIARAIEEESALASLATIDGHVLGTPQYMSPEQARGERDRIDTRSDVYSLGVVLHQLLTDSLPYEVDTTSLLEVLRVVAQEPPKLSRKSFTGVMLPSDLRNILAKALESEPDRRYGGVRMLADDIERYLDRRPVLARRPSTLYNLRKVIERHPWAATALILLLIVSLGSAIAMSVLYRGQVVARRHETREADKSAAVLQYMESVFSAADPVEGGPDQTIGDLLDGATGRAERELADQPLLRAAVLRTLANSQAALDQYDVAQETFDGAFDAIGEVDPPDPLERARLERAYAAFEERRGHFQSAVQHSEKGLKILGEAARQDPKTRTQLLSQLFGGLDSGNRFAEAESVATLEVDYTRVHLGVKSPEYAQALYDLGEVLRYTSGWQEALPVLREATAAAKNAFGADSPKLIEFLNLLGVVTANENPEEALAIRRNVLELAEKTYGPNHSQVAVQANNLATALLNARRFEEAEPYALEAFEIWEHTKGLRHTYSITGLANLGYLYANRCQFDRALDRLMLARSVCDSLPDVAFDAESSVWANLGLTYLGLGRFQDAEASFGRALEIQRASLGEKIGPLAWNRSNLGTAYLELGEPTKAQSEIEAVQEFIDTWKRVQLWGRVNRHRLARVEAALGDSARARKAIEELAPELLQVEHLSFNLSFELARGAKLLRSWGDGDLAERYEARLKDSPCACLDSLSAN